MTEELLTVSTSSLDSPPAKGRRVVLLRMVGKGGFGEVYEGRMETPGGLTRRVAVKLLRADVVDQDTLARTHDEAHLLSRLSHPMIVGVEDLIKVDDRLAIISEYVDGVDLSERMPLETGVALEVISKVAEALHAAWSAPGPDGEPMRIVHRDLKPSNIRLGPHGVVKLLDFGIARPGTGVRRVKTGSGLLVGSLGYVPPERWNGTGEGHASDVYALGCVLLEAITDEPLFAGLAPVRQLALAGDASSHQAHLEARLQQAGLDGHVAALIRDMVQWEDADRPSALQVARRARRVAAELAGEGLLSWSGTIVVGGTDWSTAEGTVLSETDRGFTLSGLSSLTPPTTRELPELALDPTTTVVPAPRKRSGWSLILLSAAVVVGLGALLLGGAGLASGVGLAVWSGLPWTDPVPPSGPGGLEVPEEAPVSEPDLDPDAAVADGEGETGGRAPDAAPEDSVALARRPAVRPAGSVGEVEPVEPPTVIVVPPPQAPTPDASGSPAAADTVDEPPALTGQVRIVKYQRVRLRAVSGQVVSVGDVPPGTYTLEASWEVGVWTPVVEGVQVRAGERVQFRCEDRFRKCVREG